MGEKLSILTPGEQNNLIVSRTPSFLQDNISFSTTHRSGTSFQIFFFFQIFSNIDRQVTSVSLFLLTGAQDLEKHFQLHANLKMEIV